MVSVGVSALGRTSIHSVEPSVKVNGQYYRDVLLMQELLPDIRQMSEFNGLARQTVDLLTKETPDFIPSTL